MVGPLEAGATHVFLDEGSRMGEGFMSFGKQLRSLCRRAALLARSGVLPSLIRASKAGRICDVSALCSSTLREYASSCSRRSPIPHIPGCCRWSCIHATMTRRTAPRLPSWMMCLGPPAVSSCSNCRLPNRSAGSRVSAAPRSWPASSGTMPWAAICSCARGEADARKMRQCRARTEGGSQLDITVTRAPNRGGIRGWAACSDAAACSTSCASPSASWYDLAARNNPFSSWMPFKQATQIVWA
mmetsp:Transcript_28799/g.77593  ORF Transcript_28799/g.77593 Transcript_28799/m.77593 type:complete len:243 (+) Transcript_28799:336-1064(+)